VWDALTGISLFDLKGLKADEYSGFFWLIHPVVSVAFSP